jgi:hypothetical protein
MKRMENIEQSRRAVVGVRFGKRKACHAHMLPVLGAQMNRRKMEVVF